MLINASAPLRLPLNIDVIYNIDPNLVSRAFPLKNGWGAPPIFEGKSPGDEVDIDPNLVPRGRDPFGQRQSIADSENEIVSTLAKIHIRTCALTVYSLCRL